MMSTKYTELSISDDQLACFAHLLKSSHRIGKFEQYFLKMLCANTEAKLFKGPFLNIDSHCVMHCVVHR